MGTDIEGLAAANLCNKFSQELKSLLLQVGCDTASEKGDIYSRGTEQQGDRTVMRFHLPHLDLLFQREIPNIITRASERCSYTLVNLQPPNQPHEWLTDAKTRHLHTYSDPYFLWKTNLLLINALQW